MPSVYDEAKMPSPKNAAAKAAVRIADQNPSRLVLFNELSLPCPVYHISFSPRSVQRLELD